ncbi:MAG: hypothetical protein WCZ28_03530 [Burkholderiaceae bacterium]
MPSTLAFDIGPVRRQRARWPGVGAVLGLSAAGLCILLDPPLPASVLGLLVVLAVLLAWAGWRSGRPSGSGRLLVDPAGNAAWLAAPGGDPARAVALVPRRWQLGAAEIWLLAEDRRGLALHLRLGRRDCDERQWRAMCRWLVWTGRAGPSVIAT